LGIIPAFVGLIIIIAVVVVIVVIIVIVLIILILLCFVVSVLGILNDFVGVVLSLRLGRACGELVFLIHGCDAVRARLRVARVSRK
jgi:hypothetical protein